MPGVSPPASPPKRTRARKSGFSAPSNPAGKRRFDDAHRRDVILRAAGLRAPEYHTPLPVGKAQKIEARVLADALQIRGERSGIAAREIVLHRGSRGRILHR